MKCGEGCQARQRRRIFHRAVMEDADGLAIGIEEQASLIMESDGLATAAAYTGTDEAVEDLNHCRISLNLQEECDGKEMDATGDLCKNDTQGVDHGERLNLQGNSSHLGAADDILEQYDSLIGVHNDTWILNDPAGCTGKEMHARRDLYKNDAQGADHGEGLKRQGSSSHLGAQDDILEPYDSLIMNSDSNDTLIQDDATGFTETSKTVILDVDCGKQEVSDSTFGSSHLLHQTSTSPESSREEDTDRELSDLTTQSGESWELMTYDSNTEDDDIQSNSERSYSDLSTLRAESTDRDASTLSLVDSDSFILNAESIEAEVDADGNHLPSCDSLSSDIEFMETNYLGLEDFNLVPMDPLDVSLVSNNSETLNEIGAGSTAFHSLNFSITGADWHMASLPVKCLEMGAVNVASLTLGTVGISVIPFVSPGTIDINPIITSSIRMVPIEPVDWETWSMDSMSLAMTTADYVNVDSITPEGVRECWHPLGERLYALGEALTALDKKLEGFSPRIQEAETLLNEVELSFSQHAMHVSDIMKENNALAERVLLLEERLGREKRQQQIG